jgi:DNA-binding GntR family transcriptional regulator
MVFVADDLAGWLIGLLADAGRKKLTSLVLGSEQERALRAAATAAVQLTAGELRPGDTEQAEHVALVISQVFGEPVPAKPLARQGTVLGALQAGIAAQLAVLDDARLTGTGQSSAEVLGTAGAVVAATLTGHLVREIVTRGARGGPLFPLASQLNDDVTHLQGQRIEAVLGQLTGEVREALAQLDQQGVRHAPVKKGLQAPSRPTESRLEVKVLDDPPDAVRAVLELGEDERVVRRRVITRDGEAGHSRSSSTAKDMIQTAYFPIRLAEQMGAKQLLSKKSIRQGSHQYLTELGFGTDEYHERFAIRPSFPDEAAKLGIDDGSPVTYHIKVHYRNQRPLWCSVTIHVGAERGMGSK